MAGLCLSDDLFLYFCFVSAVWKRNWLCSQGDWGRKVLCFLYLIQKIVVGLSLAEALASLKEETLGRQDLI